MPLADHQAVPCLVSVRSPSLEVFLDDFGVWISDSDMFLPTGKSPPVDSPIRLDLRVGSDWRLIQGTGRVTWVRAEAEAPEKPAGFNVEFANLENQSRKLLRWILEDRKATESFDDPPTAAASRQSRIEIVTGSEAGWVGWEVEKKTPKKLLGAGLALLLLVLAGSAFLLFRNAGESVAQPVGPDTEVLDQESSPAAPADPIVQPDAEPTPEGTADPGVVAAWEEHFREAPDGSLEVVPEETVGEPDEPDPLLPQAPEEGDAPTMEEGVTRAVERAVFGWASAWEDRRVAEYLAGYSQDFVPPEGMGRAEWEAWCRDRIEQPSVLEVDIEDLRLEELSDSGAVVTFEQSWRSDEYQDRVTKQLRLALEGDRWMIVGERVLELP